MIQLDNTKFAYNTLGAILVVTAVVIKNSHKQLKLTDNVLPLLGKALFMVGWFIVALSISINNKVFNIGLKTILSFVSVGLIVFAVNNIMAYKDQNKDVPKSLPLMFVGGWLLLALSITYGSKHTYSGILAFLGALSVFASMLYALPMQRKKNVVDGPGAYLFSLGWVFIIFANALTT